MCRCRRSDGERLNFWIWTVSVPLLCLMRNISKKFVPITKVKHNLFIDFIHENRTHASAIIDGTQSTNDNRWHNVVCWLLKFGVVTVRGNKKNKNEKKLAMRLLSCAIFVLPMMPSSGYKFTVGDNDEHACVVAIYRTSASTPCEIWWNNKCNVAFWFYDFDYSRTVLLLCRRILGWTGWHIKYKYHYTLSMSTKQRTLSFSFSLPLSSTLLSIIIAYTIITKYTTSHRVVVHTRVYADGYRYQLCMRNYMI